MKSFRQMFVENHIWAKDTKTYRYSGNWYSFCDSKQEKTRRKKWFLVLESSSVLAFLIAGTRMTALNLSRVFGGILGLSVVPYLTELLGVFLFLIGKNYLTEEDYKWTDGCILYGASLRVGLLLLGGILEWKKVVPHSGEEVRMLLFYGISMGMSFVTFYIQKKISYHVYRNENGCVGSEY